MKILSKSYFLGLMALFISLGVYAQDKSLILGGSVSDSKKYTMAYLAPLERGMADASANGLINFTNSGKQVRFNFGINFSSAITPSSQRSFDINDLGLEEFKASDPNKTIAQTISGSDETIDIETKTTYYKPHVGIPIYEEVPLAKFESPAGIGVPLMPLPILSFGIYTFGTHLNFNLLPNLHTTKEVDYVSYGVSLQHNLEASVPAMKEWTVKFAVSAAYQYTNLKYHLDIQPDETKIGLELTADNGPYDNQLMDVDITSIPLQLIAYRDFSSLTLYGSVGYNITTSAVALKGNYPMYIADPAHILKVGVKDIVDPYSYDRSYNHFRFDLGLNYQIGFMKFKASYTLSEYQVFHIGLGVSI